MSGESFAVTEDPDLAIAYYIGNVSADDVRRLTDIRKAFCRDKAYIFMIIDLQQMTQFSKEARRVAAQTSGTKDDPVTIHGAAIVGASFHYRVIGNMLFRAIHSLRHTNAFPVEFFATHAEARAWFDRRRQQLGLRR